MRFNPILRRRNVIRGEGFPAVVVDVEARPVPGIFPRLHTHLDRSPDFLEVACDVQNTDHAKK